MHEAWAAIGGEPTLASVGEAGALAAILPRLPGSASRILGPGDDAAVLAAPDGRFVVTSDSMVAGPDFRLEWSTPFDVGWKLAAVNLADIAAMGARPTALVVALAVPPELPVRVLEDIADGLREACAALAPGCGVEGGDLASSPVVTAVATAFGSLDGREAVRRSGARVGDVVAVSGRIGAAAAGLQLLAAGGPGSPGFADALAAQLRPSPPIADGVIAAEAGATAMIDVSDGLGLDASRVAAASGASIDLVAAEARRVGGTEPWDAAAFLAAAEDHALLAAFPPEARLPGGFRPIGRVVVRAAAGVLVDGVPAPVVGGWDPFGA